MRVVWQATRKERSRNLALRHVSGSSENHRLFGKLHVLPVVTQFPVSSRGHAEPALVDAFFAAGWSKANLVDVIAAIGDKTVTNYLHGTTLVPVDFPAAPALPV